MGESRWALDHTYRIVMAEDGARCAQILEFEAAGSDVALFRAQKYCLDRDLEMFEDGRSLGHLKWHEGGGFWVLTPPRPPVRAPVRAPVRTRSQASSKSAPGPRRKIFPGSRVPEEALS